MVRKLALSLAVAAAITAGQANALGLGEIRVNSALNEPLDADIRLVQVRDLSPLQIMPRMADVDEFSLAGLSKSRFLSDVKFQVKIEPDGSGSIHVTSSVPVQEPFLSFLMEVNWPNGRLVREYTLLLDPPVFDPAPVTTTISAPSALQQPAAPKPVSAPTQAKPKTTANIKTNMGGSEVFVNNNDTLYVLAKNNRPASDISIEQMMIAMQRKNPQIFPTGNINVMRAGKVMQIPTAEEARALTRKQAIAEAARQTAEWKAGRRAATAKKEEPAKPVDTPAEASGTAEGAPGTEADSQLKIVTAEPQAEAETEVSSEAAPDEEVSAEEALSVAEAEPGAREMELMQRNEELENRLLMTQESVDKVSRENADLGEKLDSIQEQLVAMQRLIELKDQQMAALQAEMLKQAQEANKPKPSAVDEFINMLMANPIYLGGAGGVLVLLLALMALARRRKRGEYEEESVPRKRKKSKKSEPETDEIPEFDEADELDTPAPSSAAPAAAVAAGAVAGAAAAQMQDEELDELDDLADLDLDMDLDLDESTEVEEAAPQPIPESELEAEGDDSEIDSVLDDILNDDVDTEFEAGEIDDLDALLDEDAEVDTDVDELARAEDEVIEDDELEGLAFAVDDSDGESEVAAEADEMIDDEFFSEEVEPESDQVSSSEEPDEADLIDEPMEFDLAEESGLDTLPADESLDDLVDDDLDALLMESAEELKEDEAAQFGKTVAEVEAEAEAEAATQTAEVGDDEDEEDLDLDFNVVKPTADEDLEAELLADNLSTSADEDEDLDFNFDLPDEEDSLIEDAVGASGDASGEEESEEEAGADDLDEMLSFDMELLDDDEPEAETRPEPEPEPKAEDGEDLDFDLDAMISGLDDEASSDEPQRAKKPGELVEEELTANIAHDLDLSLDDDIEEMLAEDEGDIELVEEGDEDLNMDEGFDLLDGADEVETKLDLARAYIEMDDTEGARDILGEIVRDGSAEQQAEAQSLLDKLS